MQDFLLDFKWKKVFWLKDNMLWEICWVLFDIEYEKVIWFVLKKNFLEKSWILLLDIISLSSEYISVSQEKTFDIYDYDLYLKQVRSSIDGKVIGNVENIFFDSHYKLKNIYIDAWYHFSSLEFITPTKISIRKNILSIAKKKILSYQKDFILVENIESLKENKKTLEKISKIFINIPNPSYTLNFKKYELHK